tara:strand:- start:1095 stop:1262 length:168 start_codon:yes stop_codon:yes gene_type:complete
MDKWYRLVMVRTFSHEAKRIKNRAFPPLVPLKILRHNLILVRACQSLFTRPEDIP